MARRLRVPPVRMLVVCAIAGLLTFGAIVPTPAQVEGQYRAFWVDTFNSRLNSPADVTAIVERAVSAHANALFVQVRRRGDAWYVRGREPRPEGVPIEANFDPLADVLAQAHAAGIEVHAFVVLGAIWNQSTLPASGDHVFNQHGFNGAGPVPGAANWLTRTRLPDGAQTSHGGYRFGTDFWLDFGHPDAAAYTVDLLLELVKSYDIDGLHLDRLQYPEVGGTSTFSGAGGASVGYNDVSLERFRRHYQLPAGTDPAPFDPQWNDWRRAQISGLMRRIYLGVTALKPRLKVSAGVVANGQAPGSESEWTRSEAYARTFQDWRAWMEEGLLDIVVPLNFKAEHTGGMPEAFASWVTWTRDHQYQRQALMGVGSYLNSVEGTLRQVRRSLEPASNPLDGVVLYSIGAHNAPVTSNPLAQPATRDTPLRPFEDLVAGLRTGRTAAGQALEAPGRETTSTLAGGVFAADTPVPLTGFSDAFDGRVMGTIRTPSGQPLDSAEVVVERADGGATLSTTTDGGGFYGRMGVAPGVWRLSVIPAGDGRYVSDCTIEIGQGPPRQLDLDVDPARPGVARCQQTSPSRR